jgi:hypothetical protein
VSGIQSVTLKYRLDADGANPIGDNENETYTGGAGVGAWQSIAMNYRNFPTGNVTNNPEISFFILPDYIAGEYWTPVTGITEKLVDYYIEATDTKGNLSKTAIQHVWVGPYNSGGGNSGVTWSPAFPTAQDVITITETDVTQGAKLHWGVNVNGTAWQSPLAAYWPAGSALFNGTGPAVESPMAGPVSNSISIQIGPFNNPAQKVNAVNFVIHYNNNTWNNNNGQDFHIPINNNPVGTEASDAKRLISVWPVPADETLNVGVPMELTSGHWLVLRTASGQQFLKQPVTRENFTINLSTLPSGLYILSVYSPDQNLIINKKVIKR